MSEEKPNEKEEAEDQESEEEKLPPIRFPRKKPNTENFGEAPVTRASRNFGRRKR